MISIFLYVSLNHPGYNEAGSGLVQCASHCGRCYPGDSNSAGMRTSNYSLFFGVTSPVIRQNHNIVVQIFMPQYEIFSVAHLPWCSTV